MPQFTSLNNPENVDLDKQNSGIFWSIRDKGTRVGHSGGDPGVSTKMRYDPSKEIGVIIFMNTSLNETGMMKFDLIYDELWNYALTTSNSEPISR